MVGTNWRRALGVGRSGPHADAVAVARGSGNMPTLKHMKIVFRNLLRSRLALCTSVVLVGLVNPDAVRAAYGFFETYAILNVNGGGNTYYDAGAATGNPDFQGANFGTLNPALNSLILRGGEAKTFKNGGSDVFGANLAYRIWSGSASGSFTEIPLGFNANLGGGDQKWDRTDANVNLLSGLGNGVYTLEIYFRGTGNGGDFYHSNGGINYQATFTVVPEPVTVALGIFAAVGGVGGLVRWRRKVNADTLTY